MPAPTVMGCRTEKRDRLPMATRRSGYTPSASASSSRPRCKSRAYLGDEAQKELAAEAAGSAGGHDVVAFRTMPGVRLPAVDRPAGRNVGAITHASMKSDVDWAVRDRVGLASQRPPRNEAVRVLGKPR